MTTSNYSLHNSYNAEFGRVGQYFANRAAKDLKEVMDSGATQEVIDDVVKRAIDSGERQVKQKAQRFGKKVRRLWKASPKLRRNVKLAGVAGAGLVGLNALTGLKTVYDIGKGIKNKVMPKKQQNTQYSLFNPYAVEFAQNQQEKSELRRWSGAARNSALVGGGLGLGITGIALSSKNARKAMLEDGVNMKTLPYQGLRGGVTQGLALGLGGYGAYRGGKALLNKIRGKRKKEANYNQLNTSLANFKETQEQPKKKSLLKKGLKYAAIGGAGLVGLGAAARYGGAALKYRKAYNFLSNPEKFGDKLTIDNIFEQAAIHKAGGAKGQLKRDIERFRTAYKKGYKKGSR